MIRFERNKTVLTYLLFMERENSYERNLLIAGNDITSPGR